MGVRIEITGYAELIKALDRIDDTMSFKVGKEMVKEAAVIVADRARDLVHQGDPAHHPESPPLVERIGIEQRYYHGGKRALAIVGPIYQPDSEGGNHGHLLEYGHKEVLYGRRTGRQVPPYPFLRPAFDETQGEQLAAMEAVVTRTIQELGL